jgi:curved DNA-binding protein CbpA
MNPDERALAPRRALVPTGAPVEDPVAAAQARLAAALEEVTALDAEVEALSAGLAAFAGEVERRLAGPDAEARRAASLVRRLQALADGLASELTRLRAAAEGAALGRSGSSGATGRRPRGRAGRGAAPGGGRGEAKEAWADPDAAEGEDAEEQWPAARDGGDGVAEEIPTLERQAAELKRLYRRLARLLHPDLAPDEADRERLSALMARANAAYEAEDLAALELMAARVGAGEPPGELTEAERLLHLSRRAEQLARVAASLQRERRRLSRSETARLRAEAGRRAAAGQDYFAESMAELDEEAGAARTDALARLEAVARAAREVGKARRKIMGDLERSRAGGIRRAFDPVAESPLVRRSAARLESARATAPALALARWLEAAAEAEGTRWEAGLTLLAWLMEVAGERPPPTVATAAGLAGRWARLAAGWPGAPDLAGALARLPRHLTLGARAGREEVVAGLQLAEASLAAGVQVALSREAVAARAREVLSNLGPEERCASCRRQVLGLHLLRTSGLDERHGIACPSCGAVLRSYWRYGEAEGLEGLWPVARSLGLAAEQAVRLGGVTLAFGMRPADLAVLTAGGLVERFEELYLAPCRVALPRAAVRVAARGSLITPRTRLAGAGRISLTLTEAAGTTAEGLVELLRGRIERRFRPGGEGA